MFKRVLIATLVIGLISKVGITLTKDQFVYSEIGEINSSNFNIIFVANTISILMVFGAFLGLAGLAVYKIGRRKLKRH